VPFYGPKNIVYCVYTISMGKASPGRLMSCLHWKAHVSVGVRSHARSALAVTCLHDNGGRVNLYLHIDVRHY
jgi:hypothetical protein